MASPVCCPDCAREERLLCVILVRNLLLISPGAAPGISHAVT